jgi:regulator of sirC expression with transglutaminase-like and TPR domain
VSAPLQPLKCRPECYRAFGSALQRLAEPGGLLQAAAAIALHEHPEADLALVEARTEALAAEVRRRAEGRSTKARLGFLHEVLFDEHGYRGDEHTYSNPSNSYLPAVLATKRGLPITLSLLYVEVARRAGLAAHGVDAPTHFLVEIEDPPGVLIVDPFQGGRALTQEEVFSRLERVLGGRLRRDVKLLPRATPAGWLDRMLRNLEGSFARAGRLDDFAAMGELRALLAATTPLGGTPEPPKPEA